MRVLPRSVKPSVALLLLTPAGASSGTRPATQPAGGGPETLDGLLPNLRQPIDIRPTRVSLADAVQAVRDRCLVRIDVDWSALHAIGVERDARVRVRLRDVKVSRALKMICNYFDGGEDNDHSIYLIPSDDGRSVVLTNMAGLQATAVDRDYPVGDLIHPVDRNPPAPSGPPDPLFVSGSVDQAPALDPKEELVQHIKENVDPNSWKDAGGHIGEVTVGGDNPSLHVHQTPANQHKVEAALAQFRENKQAAINESTSRP